MLPNPIEEQPLALPKCTSEARHSSRCRVCLHPQRAAIERSFVRRTLTVADICTKYNIGRDSVYRHSDALNLIEPRNRNWRAPVIPDNSDAVSTETVETGASEKTVLPAEKEATVYARAMIELLLLKPDNDLLSAIEEAIEAKSRDSRLPIDLAANQIHIVAALTKIKREPDNWPMWFRNRGYEKEL